MQNNEQNNLSSNNKQNSDYCVCVLDKDRVPMMPTRRFGKVRHMLKDGRAKVVCDKSFTIQRQYEPETHGEFKAKEWTIVKQNRGIVFL